jgi:hypothetical protein
VSGCAAPDDVNCECAGCALPQCDDMMGGLNDCVCPNCANDPYCSNPMSCNSDGVCDPFNEGCLCADCADHPLCGGPGTCPSTMGTGGAGGAGGGSGVGGGGMGGGGGMAAFTCEDVINNPQCSAPDPVACECAGCVLPQCDDMMGNFNDCTCANCANDPFCSDPQNCNGDTICEPFIEGCVCSDCADHPACP